MKQGKTLCFTGHRPQSLPFGFNESDIRCTKLKEKLRAEIIRQITDCGVTHFISGMALGVDVYAAEIVLELKKQYPQITLECAIPCENQAAKWREPDRDRYFGIIEHCDKETMLQKRYTQDCISMNRKTLFGTHMLFAFIHQHSKTESYILTEGKNPTESHPQVPVMLIYVVIIAYLTGFQMQ